MFVVLRSLLVYLLRVKRGAFFRLGLLARRLLVAAPIFFAPLRWGFGGFLHGVELLHGIVGLIV